MNDKKEIIKNLENKLNSTSDEQLKRALEIKLKALKGNKTVLK